jgi:hypothetical protein
MKFSFKPAVKAEQKAEPPKEVSTEVKPVSKFIKPSETLKKEAQLGTMKNVHTGTTTAQSPQHNPLYWAKVQARLSYYFLCSNFSQCEKEEQKLPIISHCVTMLQNELDKIRQEAGHENWTPFSPNQTCTSSLPSEVLVAEFERFNFPITANQLYCFEIKDNTNFLYSSQEEVQKRTEADKDFKVLLEWVDIAYELGTSISDPSSLSVLDFGSFGSNLPTKKTRKRPTPEAGEYIPAWKNEDGTYTPPEVGKGSTAKEDKEKKREEAKLLKEQKAEDAILVKEGYLPSTAFGFSLAKKVKPKDQEEVNVKPSNVESDIPFRTTDPSYSSGEIPTNDNTPSEKPQLPEKKLSFSFGAKKLQEPQTAKPVEEKPVAEKPKFGIKLSPIQAVPQTSTKVEEEKPKPKFSFKKG